MTDTETNLTQEAESEPIIITDYEQPVTDSLIIERLTELLGQRRHVPSRKLWKQVDELLRSEYEVTDELFDNKIKDMIKIADSVTYTCSARFKTKLDVVQLTLEE